MFEKLLSVMGLGGKILDKVIPDAAQRDAAKLKLLELQQAGEFKDEDLRFSAITAEATSADKWTSRARPAFMYVMYILFLAAIPFSILNAFRPDLATAVTAGMKAWLEAIPEEMYWLFGSGYLGYTAARSHEKVKKVTK